MIQINLTEDEVQLLKDLVDSCLYDLRTEIHATDNYEYKDMLKKRKGILLKLSDAISHGQNLQLID